MALILLLQSCEMLVIEPVRNWNEFLVPAIVARFVAPDEQDRASPWIEGLEDSVRAAGMLDARFLHMRVLRGSHHIRMGAPKGRAIALQQDDLGVDVLLLLFREAAPPLLKFFGELDLPFHRRNIT
jgi:hypothetical protein